MGKGLGRNRLRFARASFSYFRFAFKVNCKGAYLRDDVCYFFVGCKAILLDSAHNLFGDYLQSRVFRTLVYDCAVLVSRRSRTVPSSVVFALVYQWVEIVVSSISFRLRKFLLRAEIVPA
jgi:hypothetical protein